MQESENDRLLDHSYDGIEEYDNPLPTWWKLIFYATILVVPLYLWDPIGIGVGPGKEEAYAEQLAAFDAARPKSAGVYTDEQLASFGKDPARVAAGKALFATYCVACHRADGGGLIGPNLTDDSWIHGGRPTEILKTVNEGVLAKGMPPWSKVLKVDQVEAAMAFVLSLQGTNPANAKATEGARTAVDPEPAPASGAASSASAKKGN